MRPEQFEDELLEMAKSAIQLARKIKQLSDAVSDDIIDDIIQQEEVKQSLESCFKNAMKTWEDTTRARSNFRAFKALEESNSDDYRDDY